MAIEEELPEESQAKGTARKSVAKQSTGVRPPPRASSPAKRPASEMDDPHIPDGRRDMDIDMSSPGVTSMTEENSAQSSSATAPQLPQRSTGDNNLQRSTSVDMLGDTPNTASITAAPSSVASSETTSTSNQGSSGSIASATSLAPSSITPVPSLDEQFAQVMGLMNKELQEGQEGYVVSSKWLERVIARTSEHAQKGGFDKSALEGEIGPVDNSDLITDGYSESDLRDEKGEVYIPLKAGVRLNNDFEVLPGPAWKLIVSWYGLKEGSPVLRRFVHNTSPDESTEANLQYELFPPIFTIRKVRDDSNKHQQKDSQALASRLLASRETLFQKFLADAKKAAGVDIKTRVQLWRVIEVERTDEGENGRSGMLTPATSRSGSPSNLKSVSKPPVLIDVAQFTALAEGTQREMVDIKDETMNEKYNGHLKLETVGLSTDQVLIIEEQMGGPGGGEFISDTTRKAAKRNTADSSKAGGAKTSVKSAKGALDSGRSSPAPASAGAVTRGRARKDGRTRGTVGLTNLGNTCYMNSALQCIRSVEELTIYFLQDKYKRDINSDNPLGHGGTIAKVYAGLLNSIYSDTAMSSFAPKNFKFTVGRAQPLFSGYGQQDSQEFLSFLVDGLHEDLNRILKKPYVENPESDDNTVNNPDAIRELGEKFREIHRARNDSIAMDLFNGFYKNTMVCPTCAKVSITFDPFSLLTLQLPIEQTWQHTIYFAPLHGPPMQIDVDIDKNSTIRGLKEYVAQRVPGLQWNRLIAAEIYSRKFYRTFEDSKVIAECNIQSRDEIILYELDEVPTNFPPPKKKHKVRSMLTFSNVSSDDEIPDSDSPMGDRMVVPLFHRIPSANSYGNTKSLQLWPSFILITREEAQDYDAIMKKILAKVATMTTRDILTEASQSIEDSDSRNGSDSVISTEEDASSTGDVEVQARSVEGEEGLVDVSMSEPAEGRSTNDQVKDTQMADEEDTDDKATIHEVLRPGTYIPPQLQSLFQIKFSRAGSELVATGWNAIDGTKDYPLLQSRLPMTQSRRSSVQSQESVPSEISANSETVEEEEPEATPPQFSFDQGGASDDEGLPPVNNLLTRHGRQKGNRKGNRGKNNKRAATYGRKGKNTFKRPAAQPEPVFERDDNPALLRLGEALVLDWEPDFFKALFSGHGLEGDLSGSDTWKHMSTLEDPELEAKKAKRAARKKSGVSLEECFDETAKGEILSEENAWYCNRCKELRRASKKLEIWTVPDILVVHLKRFSAHRSFRDKVDVLVDFPTEGLDLSGRVGLDEDKSLVYDLFAVDNHYGGLGGGHYTAFAKNFYDEKWYEYNDSQVSLRQHAKSVVTPAAYLLFYRRRQATPLGPPYLQKLVAEAYAPESESQPPSRSESPSGNGQRLGGSSPSGSSGALAGAGAGAALQHGGGLGGEGTGKSKTKIPDLLNYENDRESDELQSAPEYDGNEYTGPPNYSDDEGIGGDDGYGNGPMSLMGPMTMAQTYSHTSWSFDGIGTSSRAIDDAYGDDDDDADSTAPAQGSNLGEDLNDRLMTDFGDAVFNTGPRARENTPDSEPPELVVDENEVAMGHSPMGLDDGPVAEVRVDEKEDLKLD